VVYAWGSNSAAQLGIGDTYTEKLTPFQISGLTNVTAIAANKYQNLAMKSDGTIWFWGSSTYYTPILMSDL
jgi:alpha-tubulin suppressor-like RCC1 family protein